MQKHFSKFQCRQKGVFPPQRDPARGGTTLLVVAITIIAVAVVAVGGAFAYQYIFKDRNLNDKNLNDQNQNQTDQTAGWKTYTNTQLGFSLSYPADFANVNDLTGTQQDSLGSYMAVCLVGGEHNARIDPTKGQNSFCYIGEQKSDGFVVASLNITVDPSENMQACQKINSISTYNDQVTKQTDMNGITFYQDRLGDAAAGHYETGNSYRTYHEGACYTIDLYIESDRGTLEKGLNADFSSMMRSKLESIFFTFKFTK